MVAQDLTKFTVVLVILGVVLAVAIFRPEILPAEAAQSTSEGIGIAGETTPLSRPGESESVSAENLLPWEEELEQRTLALDKREAELDQRQYELDQRQADLDEREAGLDQRQAEINERTAGLQEQVVAMQDWEGRLIEQESLLGQERTRLQGKETSLAKWEQELEGRLRLSVAGVVVSGLMGVPALVVLLVLMWGGQRTPDKGVQRAQDARPYQGEQAAQHSGLAAAIPAPTFRDDGRGKESVAVACRKEVIQTVR